MTNHLVILRFSQNAHEQGHITPAIVKKKRAIKGIVKREIQQMARKAFKKYCEEKEIA
jgi:hypothetical protein